MMTTTPTLATVAADLPNVAIPLPGIVTAGQPRAEDFARLAAAGCATVLDLRAPEEDHGHDEPAAVAAAGLDYVGLPVRSSAPDDATFAAARALLRDDARRPMLFHCRSANRVGGLLLPYLILDAGMGREAALALAARVGLRDQELARHALDYVARQRPGVAR